MISEQFQAQCKLASTEIKSSIEKVDTMLQKQVNSRDETAQFLINSFGDEIIKLEDILHKEREMRIEKNDELLRLINSIDDGLSNEIIKEKKEMMESIEVMENMLEDFCYKI